MFKKIDLWNDDKKIYNDMHIDEWFPHDLTDKLPKKTVSQQIEDMILSGQKLSESRRAMLSLPDCPDDVDVDDLDSGCDEYSDRYDFEQAVKVSFPTRKKSDKVASDGSAGGSPRDSSNVEKDNSTDIKTSVDSSINAKMEKSE